jgi:hypothetical protein
MEGCRGAGAAAAARAPQEGGGLFSGEATERKEKEEGERMVEIAV